MLANFFIDGPRSDIGALLWAGIAFAVIVVVLLFVIATKQPPKQ